MVNNERKKRRKNILGGKKREERINKRLKELTGQTQIKKCKAIEGKKKKLLQSHEISV